ncbi:MAG: hypothetical protein P1P67_09750, partial [Treponema phagedenis]|uniref:hypothetical protein n=1 Tax=Treponema phagedenis TaxID=162 RepID=UPI003133EF54
SWALRFERNTSGFTMGTAGKKHVQTAASFRAPLTLRLFGGKNRRRQTIRLRTFEKVLAALQAAHAKRQPNPPP